MKYLCIIHNFGDCWRITGFEEKEASFKVDPKLYKEVDSTTFQKLKELFISKHISFSEEERLSAINFDTLILSDKDTLSHLKIDLTYKVTREFMSKFNPTNMYLFFKFCVLNNILNDAGVFIYNSNKEEKLKQLENSEQLKAQAQEFITLIEKFNVHLDSYEKSHSILKEIEYAGSREELLSIIQKNQLPYNY